MRTLITGGAGFIGSHLCERFLAEGRFAWNSGIFLWRARAILDALATHRPSLSAVLDHIGDALGTPDEPAVIAEPPVRSRASVP